MAHRVYLGLGSNLGDRKSYLDSAISNLAPVVRVTKLSPIYETAPWGYNDQDDFLNMVVEAETELGPKQLLVLVKGIEVKLGRQPRFRNGPREIDIDILLFDDLILDEPGLRIPHPRLKQRAFILAPLADLAPDFKIPNTGKTVSECLTALDKSGSIPLSKMKPLNINNKEFAWGSRTYVMGILNITPDSFSGDGLAGGADSVYRAMAQGKMFANSGADILDVGGESTRPGAASVTAEEEIARVIPIIQALKGEVELTISIDTYKAEVAAAALDAGAHMVNDVWGLRADPEQASLVAERGVPIVLMHNRSNPANAELRDRLGGRYIGVEYQNLIEDIKRELMESVAIAKKAGVSDEQIVLDPGIGFGKTVEQNLELLDRCGEIRELGYPLLVGPSRKSFIGYTLDLPPDQRVEGTSAAVAVAIARGADMVRVHDVEAITRVAKMTDAIVRRSEIKK